VTHRRPVHVDDRESAAAARGRLVLLLAGATNEALARMTAEGLASTHRVPAKDCEYALIIERNRRAARNG
jgi:hypothetical protein